jgi:hypothetical protein
VEEDDIISEDTIVKYPKWNLDGVKVTNVIEVKWGFNEGTGLFEEKDTFENATSISLYGRQTPLKYEFKGIKEALDGENLIQDFGTRLIERLSNPTPIVDVTTQIDKSLQTIGDKAYLVSSKIPAADGTLNFASNLEIVSRSINQTSGDVQFKLAFTSFTNIRSGFIAPSDLVVSVISQKKITVAVGRGSFYLVGWYMRLWSEVTQTYFADAPNKITQIDGDSITFENDWTTILTPVDHRMRFADYDEATDSQKRYGFISDSGMDFADGQPTYKVTF